MNRQKVIIPKGLREHFNQSWKNNRVIIFSAFCGYGKTTIALKLLENKKVCMKKVEKDVSVDLSFSKQEEVMFIEDIHLLKDKEMIQQLCEMIRDEKGIRLVLTTRGTMPEWLFPLQLSGRVKLFQEHDLRFGERELFRCAEMEGVNVSKLEAARILEKSKGYPLGVCSFVHYLAEGGAWGERANVRAAWRIFGYIEENLFKQLEKAEQEFLLQMAPFEEFSIDFALRMNPECNVRKVVEGLLLDTTTLLHVRDEVYEFNFVMRTYIMWQFHKHFTEEEKQQIYLQGSRYYEAKNNIVKALEYYDKAKEYEKITELLVLNAEQNPGVGHYQEMERYYMHMPREQVLKSPSLMCGMSMLMSMRVHYEKSEAWYQALVNYSNELDKKSEFYAKVMEKIMYLDIALPQKSNDGIMDTINKVAKYAGKRQVVLPAFSITSRLPSVMNGGKDFSDWAKRDDILYKTFRTPLNKVLKNEGIGAIECGMCESKFEKGQDYAVYLVQMMSILPQVQQLGTPDIEFAIIGTIARIHVAQGKAESAKDSLLNLRQRFVEKNEVRFISNIDAMLAHISLLQGDIDVAMKWKEEVAPKANDSIWTMWRYQYFIKIEVLIYEKEYVDALLLLAQLLTYTQQCNRRIDEIQVHCFMAICYHRMNNRAWKSAMQNAIDLAEEYQFVTTISQFGMAILPVFTAGKWSGNKEFHSKVLKAIRIHATFYQQYMKLRIEEIEKLSGMELSVLRLICQNRSNQEIGEILGIKLPTVKTHASNIYRKLEVNRRTEAKAEAIRRNLVEEYI